MSKRQLAPALSKTSVFQGDGEHGSVFWVLWRDRLAPPVHGTLFVALDAQHAPNKTPHEMVTGENGRAVLFSGTGASRVLEAYQPCSTMSIRRDECAPI